MTPRPPGLFTAQVGVRLRDRRVKLGLTQAELASLLGWNKSMVTRIENGTVNCTVEQLIVLCRAMQTRPDLLLKGMR